MGSEASTAPNASKSKQERIRDNQRRSRARRQEYLAGLERRVKECQVACREAQLQRAALGDLQVENARLRDLLNYVGISPNLVETFGRPDMQSLPHNAAAVAHRQIRPKYQQPSVLGTSDLPSATMTKQESNSELCCPPYSSPTSLGPPIPALTTDNLQVYGGNQCPPLVATSDTPTTSLPEIASLSPVSSYEWMLCPDSQNPPAFSDENFCCDAFGIPPNGPLLPPENANAVQCLIAKGIIEQYDPTPAEMDEIAARLATAFSLPKTPGSGCRVDSQLLLQILQEMDSRPKRD
ncbi:uncharacterized protein A1O5_12786 [Cladophialophora psammophila CBS 110553]|uniref:BZIP domain-containing protein n=1 Tax=Cladophialophora psammophila CBS 110553 TaxID=1182543 RepID=W9VHC2_9EURO|nr:uncharacterized protein A1O5_12786 [Cladophialophora psammophila CBS 110553]EXJ55047.1 hypothetical protein A1O5_12786 [Cladophialophora psammophila CBS 110553]